jgi:hypothetical protein
LDRATLFRHLRKRGDVEINDRTIDIPIAERNELEAELRAAHSEHKNVLRRSIESSANFYEKLAR